MSSKPTPNNLGQLGEQQAVNHLQTQNYQILDRNYRFKHLEIDIVALDLNLDEIVFVEVKTRSQAQYGHPSLSATSKKIANLTRAALVYLEKNSIAKDFRFDIISLLPKKLEHFKNVTADI